MGLAGRFSVIAPVLRTTAVLWLIPLLSPLFFGCAVPARDGLPVDPPPSVNLPSPAAPPALAGPDPGASVAEDVGARFEAAGGGNPEAEGALRLAPPALPTLGILPATAPAAPAPPQGALAPPQGAPMGAQPAAGKGQGKGEGLGRANRPPPGSLPQEGARGPAGGAQGPANAGGTPGAPPPPPPR